MHFAFDKKKEKEKKSGINERAAVSLNALSALVSNFIGSNLSGERRITAQDFAMEPASASFMWLFTSSQII
jgi:hypothetical protein